MAAAVLDSCRPLKLESPSEGGTQTDFNPVSLNSLQDAVAVAGVYVNGPSVTKADKTVLVDRASGGNLRFTDQQATQVLSAIVGSLQGGSNYHGSLPDLTHFVGGPCDGWASGATYQPVYYGPLIYAERWFQAGSTTKRIFASTYTYPGSSPLPSQCTSSVYQPDGVTIARTMKQTWAYSGPLLLSETRTWS